jgi:NADH-quinone oxidoreductase subunit D
MLFAEMTRILNHIMNIASYAMDVGAMTPFLWTFEEREKIMGFYDDVCGARLHANYIRPGGVSQDMPAGLTDRIHEWANGYTKILDDMEGLLTENRIFKQRVVDIGVVSKEQALAWGFTGPNLRASGVAWDLRKSQPYDGYEEMDFDIPIGKNGDCFDRYLVRVEEMRQSLKIIKQCLENMPAGPYKADHPLTTPPPKERTLAHIETLINHFVGVSWGPVMPAGEACQLIEATKGINSYYLTSDAATMSYRTRIRTPDHAHTRAPCRCTPWRCRR